ncbi:hypothetical protein M569_08654 [Genlisea aurea]|uniref:Uncharacterized protein n=1 Tax=Genlisea aurea TaxID=192259 RepID=S8E1D9_9LAMI|nr:hypothetical protein M569_08654 [Genlisea aurea]
MEGLGKLTTQLRDSSLPRTAYGPTGSIKVEENEGHGRDVSLEIRSPGNLNNMLSNHLENGMETAKLIWSRLPNSDADPDSPLGAGINRIDASVVESLDYEVIENSAYREEQAKRGKMFVAYIVVVKWILALLIGIGEFQLIF